MNRPERLQAARYLDRKKAYEVATQLQAAGCNNVVVRGRGERGWTVFPGGHADMVAVAKVCEANDCGVLYRPFGGAPGWPDVMIYDLDKANVIG